MLQINLISDKLKKLRYREVYCICNSVRFFSSVCSASKHYFEKYPGDHDLLWEVEGEGYWFQRTPIATVLQREKLRIAGMDALFCFLTFCKICTAECLFNRDLCEHCPWKLAERFLFVLGSGRS